MTAFDDVLAQLHNLHAQLNGAADALTDEQLIGPSAASDWRLCDVFSHLGSGAEIGNRQLTTALGEPSTTDDNVAIWDRWNARSPIDQANEAIRANAEYLATLDGLSGEQREQLTIDLGFLPHPVPLIIAAGMRLNEVALHNWDIAAGISETAEVDEPAAVTMLDLFSDELSFILGFSAKPTALGRDARVALPGYTLHVFGADDDNQNEVSLDKGEPHTADAHFEGSVGAVARLVSGRLKAPYDAGVNVVGDLSLDDLRPVFPGY